jgi:AcrR family transcriptional regulator
VALTQFTSNQFDGSSHPKDPVAAAARQLFAVRGFAGTTITAISEAAGVSAQTIYSALGTKARILARVTEVWMRETRVRALAEAYFEEPDAGRRLRLVPP